MNRQYCKQYPSWDWSGKLYPNGEFTVGQVYKAPRKVLSKERKYTQAWNTWNYETNYDSVVYYEKGRKKEYKFYSPQRYCPEKYATVDLTYVTNYHNTGSVPTKPKSTITSILGMPSSFELQNEPITLGAFFSKHSVNNVNVVNSTELINISLARRSQAVAPPVGGRGGGIGGYWGVSPQTPSSLLRVPLKRAPRGARGLSQLAGRCLRNAAYLLELDYGKKRLAMLTCTLPNLDAESMEFLARNWGDILRKFLQEFKRELKRNGAPSDYIGVTEIQEKRFKKYGQVAYHLHLLYVADKTGKADYYILAKQISKMWKRILQNSLQSAYTEGKLNVNNQVENQESWEKFYGIDCKKIKKNASAYLAKYLSKGGKILQDIVNLDNKIDSQKRLESIEQGKPYKPQSKRLLVSNWWHLTQDLRRLLKALIIPLSSTFCDWIDKHYEKLIGSKVCKKIEFCPVVLGEPREGYDRPFQLRAYVGVLTRDAYDRVCKQYVDKGYTYKKYTG